MSEIFWNSPDLEPKRNFKFQLYIRGVPTYIVKVAGRPKFSVNETEHKYLGKSFWFPGSVTWEPVSVTLVEPISVNSVAIMRDIIVKSGYNWILAEAPINSSVLSTISKKNAVAAMGAVRLEQIDSGDPISGDAKTIDSWRLMNAWIQSLEPSELSYDSDDLTDLTLNIRYDFAIIETPGSDDTGSTLSALGSLLGI